MNFSIHATRHSPSRKKEHIDKARIHGSVQPDVHQGNTVVPDYSSTLSLRDMRIRRLARAIIKRAFDSAMLQKLETPEYYTMAEAKEMRHALRLAQFSRAGHECYVTIPERLAYKYRRRISNLAWSDVTKEMAGVYHAELLSYCYTTNASERPIRILARFCALDEAVARRWLWHDNVDFQSIEGFLRRITKEQEASLDLTYQLAVEQKIDAQELPCFQEGAVNWLWNTLRLPRSHEPRWASKSALAYDFFGWNMGFQKYPMHRDDTEAPDEFARQFFSSHHRHLNWVATPSRGAFEVNQETGGLYWYLYRTLRGNALWGDPDDVKLGSWICPGFYLTLLGWMYFLLISPLMLVIFLALLTQGHSSLLFLMLGLHTPSIIALKRIVESSHMDKQAFWKLSGKTLGIVLIGLLITVLTQINYTLHAFWFCLLVVIPLAVGRIGTRADLKFWRTPVLGMPVLVVALFLVVNDLYRLTMFWETTWMIVLQVYAHVMALMQEYAKLILVSLGLALVAGGSVALIERRIERAQRCTTVYAQNINEAYTLYDIWGELRMLWYMTALAVCIFGGMGYVTAQLYPTTTVLIVSVVFVYIALTVWQISRWEENELRVGQLRRLIESSKLCRIVARNPFWWDEHQRIRRNELRALTMRVSAHESLAFALASRIHTMREYRRAICALQWMELHNHHPKSSTALVQAILDGNTREVRRLAVIPKTDLIMAESIVQYVNRLSSVLQKVHSFLRDLWCYLAIINEACPRSPDHVRTEAK
jgi:hypothetical protein